MTRDIEESDKLIDLAKQIDRQTIIEPEEITDVEELSESERQQLDRIQGALEFLNDVRSTTRKTEAIETVGGDQNETLVNPTGLVTAPGPKTKSVDRFQIERLLGKGGFAKVWLAHDTRLDRKVAVKILNPSLYASEEVATRFDREAKAAAILSHPNIVPVFESGQHDSERYIVSEYCDGQTLQHWFKQKHKATRPRMAALIAATLADALQHAHQRGIVHRDLKPANILVDLKGESGTAELDERNVSNALRIADFGLARLLHSVDENPTVEGAIVGTPAYMSPEQAMGSNDIDAASDIYSLGVILYELLTGQIPIQGNSNIDTLLAIRNTEPKRPSTISRNIPADLEAICLKCLDKVPGKRYGSAWDLGQDLQRWLNGHAVLARRPGAFERLSKWTFRNPALATTIVAIAAGLVFSGLQWKNARSQANRALRNVSFAQETIRDLVQRTSADSSIPAKLRMELVEQAISLQNRLLEEEPNNDEVIFQTAWTYRLLGNVAYDLREYQDALDALDVATDLLDGIDESSSQQQFLQPARHAIKMVRSNILNRLGRHNEAIQLFAEELEGTNPFQLASAYQTSGKAKWDSGDLEGALIDLKSSAALRISAAGDPLMLAGDVAITLLYQGDVESDLGKNMEAEETLSAALEYQTTVISSASFHESMEETMARIQHQLGKVRSRRDQFESAIILLKEAEARFKMLTQWNRTMPRYLMQWFGTSAELCRVNIQAGNVDDGIEMITEMETRFETFDPQLAEYLDYGLMLEEDHIKIAKQWQAESNSAKAGHHFERAEHWLDEMETKFPGDDSISGWRERLNEATGG